MTKQQKHGTELVDLKQAPSPRPGFVMCWASGRPFRKEKGSLFRVQHGRQRLVNRTLCVVKYYGNKCSICPHSRATLSLTAKETEDGS